MTRLAVALLIGCTGLPAPGQSLSAQTAGLEVRLLPGAPAVRAADRSLYSHANPALDAHHPTAQEAAASGASWKKGLLIGSLVGLGVGIVAFRLIDSLPCDSCSGTGSDSFADGAGPEIAFLFTVIGGGLGALIGAL